MISSELLPLLVATVFAYVALRCIYLLYFHPLAQFPGPRLAAVSNIWYAYHWLSGRYPWATERVLKEYGDVVRIAPNELLFFNPEAFTGIYSSHVKNHEIFHKTNINRRGNKHGGILFEEDPVRHRRVAKQVSPAFSSRATKAKEPKFHRYINSFIDQMKSAHHKPVDVSRWINWLAMDMSADMVYNRDMQQLIEMRNSAWLDVLIRFNMFTTIQQVSLRFPIIGKLGLLFLPFSAIRSLKEINQTSRQELQGRIQRRGETEDMDFFEQLVPGDIPSDPDEFRHLEQVATQILFAGYEPISSWFFAAFLFLLKNPEYLKILTAEIREAFSNYDDITAQALTKLEYLNACLEESLRLFPSNNTGLPRISPGALVDGVYVPPGTYVQTSIFAGTRSSRYFHDPLQFHPQRWLDRKHPLYDVKFSGDKLRSFFPFSQGPRQCPGREIAWTQARLFITKILWVFDIEEGPGKSSVLDEDFITCMLKISTTFYSTMRCRSDSSN